MACPRIEADAADQIAGQSSLLLVLLSCPRSLYLSLFLCLDERTAAKHPQGQLSAVVVVVAANAVVVSAPVSVKDHRFDQAALL